MNGKEGSVMRILFAAPDRDLLECYKKLLEEDIGETVTAFDGTQVVFLLSNEPFDIVILDRAIPRIGYKKLTDLIHGKGIPVILLSDGNKPDETDSDACLTYPFAPENIENVIRNVLKGD